MPANYITPSTYYYKDFILTINTFSDTIVNKYLTYIAYK